jgi:hypothetical protein
MAVSPHTHISGLSGLINALYVITVLGALFIAAKRYEGHPMADAFLRIYTGKEV